MFPVVEREIEIGDTLSTTDSAGEDLNIYFLKHELVPSSRLLRNSGEYEMHVIHYVLLSS